MKMASGANNNGGLRSRKIFLQRKEKKNSAGMYAEWIFSIPFSHPTPFPTHATKPSLHLVPRLDIVVLCTE